MKKLNKIWDFVSVQCTENPLIEEAHIAPKRDHFVQKLTLFGH